MATCASRLKAEGTEAGLLDALRQEDGAMENEGGEIPGVLQTSTKTLIVYSNCTFDRNALFERLPVAEGVTPVFRGKGREVDKLRLAQEAPWGSIVSLQHEHKVRGIDFRKRKGGGELRKKTEHFRNQVSIVLCLGTRKYYKAGVADALHKPRLPHIMIFKDLFKIVGCRTSWEVVTIVRLLWERYLIPFSAPRGSSSPSPPLWRVPPRPPSASSLDEGEKGTTETIPSSSPLFLIEVGMHNMGFDVGFLIDRSRLNLVMNEPQYADRIAYSKFESTKDTNVNVKFHIPVVERHPYHVLTYTGEISPPAHPGTLVHSTQADNSYRRRKKKRGPPTVSMLVFRSGQVIISGKSPQEIHSVYHYFKEIAGQRRDDIEARRFDDEARLPGGNEEEGEGKASPLPFPPSKTRGAPSLGSTPCVGSATDLDLLTEMLERL